MSDYSTSASDYSEVSSDYSTSTSESESEYYIEIDAVMNTIFHKSFNNWFQDPETGIVYIDFKPVLEKLPMGLLLFIVSFDKYLSFGVHPDLRPRNQAMLSAIAEILFANKLIAIYESESKCSWGFTIPAIFELMKFKNEKCVDGNDGLEIKYDLYKELFE